MREKGYEQDGILHSTTADGSELDLRISNTWLTLRLTLGSGSTSNNLDKFASNDGLTGTVVENLELVDHVSSVLGCVL